GQFSDVRFATANDLLEGFRTMRDLHDGHPDSGKRQEISLRLLQHRFGENAGTGAKIVDAVGHTAIIASSSPSPRPAGRSVNAGLRPALPTAEGLPLVDGTRGRGLLPRPALK